MSGRRRRSETSWEKKEESKSEANDGVMSSDFSGRPSWEPLQGNGNMPKDDAINRDRRIDEWEKPYSTRHSNDSYGALPYRGRDRGVGGSGSMSRDRDRTRSRSRDRGRGGARGVSRSRSRGRDRDRDRGRDWESTRAQSRSPFRDERQESYEYGVVDQKVGQKVDRKLTESWSRRPDYLGGYNRNSADRSRNRGSDGYKKDSGLDEDTRDIAKEAYPCKDFMRGRCHRGASCRFPHHGASGDDYHKDDRNVYDDQDRRHQLSRNSRAPPCKFFSVGKCNRDDCKFSHDGPESGRYDRRSHENFRGHNLGNKNRTWNEGEPQDDLNASDFSDFAKSNHNFGDKKSWNGPSWDDVESGRFDKSSRDNVQDHTSDDKNRTWDGPVPDSDDKKKLWDGPSWDDVNASGFSNVRKSNPNLDNKKRPWNGPSWDEVSASGLSNVPKPCHNSEDDKKGTMGGASGFSYGAKSTNNIDGKTKSWNGPLWGEASASGYADVGKSHVGDGMRQTDSKIRNWDGPGWNENTSEKNDYLMPQSTSVTNGTDTLDATVINDSHAKAVNMVSGKDSVHSVHNMSSQSLSHLSGTEQSHHTLSSNPFNGPKSQLNGPVQGLFLHRDSHKQTEIQNKEGGRPLGPREVDVPQVMNNMNETSVISEQVPQLNGLPASLPEISQKAQLPQAYTELNLANTIGFLNSLPNSASSVPCIDPMVFQHNQDTRPKEQYGSARNMEVSMSVKSSVPMGILSGSVRQENQMPAERFPPLSTGGPNSSKLSGIGVVKEYGKSPKTKKQEPVGNPEGTESKVAENAKQEQENINPDNSEAQGKAEEGNISNDEKAMRQFKTALVEFVKETLKPTWKEGKMSREVHKTIVKKVVDKVSSSIQGIQIPRTQAKIEQYLAFSKSKITKLVEAYVEKFLKA